MHFNLGMRGLIAQVLVPLTAGLLLLGAGPRSARACDGCAGEGTGLSELQKLHGLLVSTGSQMLKGSKLAVPETTRHRGLSSEILAAELLRRYPEAFSLHRHGAACSSSKRDHDHGHHHHHQDKKKDKAKHEHKHEHQHHHKHDAVQSKPEHRGPTQLHGVHQLKRAVAARTRQLTSAAKARAKRFGHKAKHTAVSACGYLAEGVSEYGKVLGLLTLMAEGVDHMILDEFVPVVGQIPFCLLIQARARDSIDIAEQYSSVIARCGGGLKNRGLAVRDLHQARGRFKQQQRRAVVGDVELKRLGPIASHFAKKNPFKDLSGSLADPKLRWLLENSSAWSEVARRTLEPGSNKARGQTRQVTLDTLVHEALTHPDRTRRMEYAQELTNSVRLFKDVASAIGSSAHHEGTITFKELMRLKWQAGRLGKIARRLGLEWMKVAARPEAAGQAQRDRLTHGIKEVLSRTMAASQELAAIARKGSGAAQQTRARQAVDSTQKAFSHRFGGLSRHRVKRAIRSCTARLRRIGRRW